MIELSRIRAVPMLADLNDRALGELARRARLHHYKPGETLWRAGTASRGLHIVLTGEVRVVRGRAGRQHIVHVEGPGGTLGEIPLFQGTGYPATAVAASRTTCLVLSREAVHAAIVADADFAFLLLERMAGRVRGLVERLERATVQNVTGRLAVLLLARAGAQPGSFTLGGTQAQVAEEIGTVREVVVRTLRELREAGVIASAGRSRWTVVDHPRLEQLAEG